MCGIAGIFRSGGSLVEDQEKLKLMLQYIIHRGPNEAGIYLSNLMSMGAVRLAIVGVEDGQQPIIDKSNRYIISYNGEVYNYIELRKELENLGYIFETNSDTEVVLNAWCAWGESCLLRFNGAFAFSIYDSLSQVLCLVRDRFGKRPLFYTKHNSSFLFASEMKCFLSFEDFSFEFDSSQLSSIFTLWTPTGNQSSYKGIYQVPIGSIARVTTDGITTKKYNEIDLFPSIDVQSEEDAVQLIRETLHEAVCKRLRSDVQVGMYLSGGLDSAILASIVADQSISPFRTYSVIFEDKEFDESYDQKSVVSRISSKHKELSISNSDIVSNLERATYHAEIPVFRTAFVPMFLLSDMVNKDGIKVVLTGEGADEAFLGYDLFKETIIRRGWNNVDDAEKGKLLKLLYPYLHHYSEKQNQQMVGLYQQFSEERYPGMFSHELRIQNGLFSKRLLGNQSESFSFINKIIEENTSYSDYTDIQKAQWLEYQTLLPGYLLSSQGDRMAMGHSVENRCPYLDPNLVSLSNSINLKFDDGMDEKYLLRRAFEAELPAAIFNKRKRPYRAPDSKAFSAVLPDYLDLILSEEALNNNEVLNAKFCRLLSSKVLSSAPNEISIKEDQAFMFMLTLSILNHGFVLKNFKNNNNCFAIDKILIKVIDQRS